MSARFVDNLRHWSTRAGNKAFIMAEGSVWTFHEVDEAARSVAARIAESASSRHPCIVMATPVQTVVSLLACAAIGKPFIVLSPDTPSAKLQYYVADSGADLLITPPSEEKNSELLEVDVHSLALADGLQEWTTCTNPDLVTCLIYTSGSTGNPKAVVCTEAAVDFAISAIQHELAYNDSDVILTSLPLNFDYGLYQVFLALESGAAIYFSTPAESGFGLSDTMSRTNATILPMVPPAVEKLVRLVQRGLKPHSVRLITTTGAALDAATRRSLEAHWGNYVDLRVMYGLTECKRVSIMPSRESYTHVQASGIPLPGTLVSIRSPETLQELAAGERGEICVAGPHLMAGYHNQQTLTRQKYVEIDAQRWLRTGDTGYVDTNGYLFCEGRNESYFKHKGFRIGAAEVTAAAKQIQGVTSAIVVPPDQEFTFTLCYEGTNSEEAVRICLATLLEPHVIPDAIRRFDALPLNANGKTDLQATKEMLRRE